jgi:hypothetical protein
MPTSKGPPSSLAKHADCLFCPPSLAIIFQDTHQLLIINSRCETTSAFSRYSPCGGHHICFGDSHLKKDAPDPFRTPSTTTPSHPTMTTSMLAKTTIMLYYSGVTPVRFHGPQGEFTTSSTSNGCFLSNHGMSVRMKIGCSKMGFRTEEKKKSDCGQIKSNPNKRYPTHFPPRPAVHRLPPRSPRTTRFTSQKPGSCMNPLSLSSINLF